MGFEPRYRRLLEGDLRGAESWAGELRDQGAAGEAECVEALRSLATGSEWPGSGPETGGAAVGTGDVLPSDWALSELLNLWARRAYIALDGAALGSSVKQLGTLDSPRARLLQRLWGGFWEATFGESGEAAAAGQELHREARTLGEATLAIDAVTLQSLHAMVLGEHAASLAHARRAARMAQSEHLWLPHYFASLFLARLRRLMGSCHLAVRIADACIKAMPAPWHGWLEWERLCAGTLKETAVAEGVLGHASAELRHWIATGGTPPVFPGDVIRSVLHRRDGDAARVGLGYDQTTSADTDLVDWIYGRRSPIPANMHGFVQLGAGSEPSSGSLVVLNPPHPARRLIARALPPGIPQLGPCADQPTRVGMLLSALALAGEDGLPRAELFEQTYGFAYRVDAHEAAFRVLRHYASSHVEGYAVLDSREGCHRLEPQRPFALVDPRTVRPFKDIMLRHLAQEGGRSAKEVAEQMGVPLRTVQSALKEMVQGGECSAEKAGRRVTYEVEDTTFLPLTMV